MKKEASKKSLKWLWLAVALAVLLAVAGVVVAMLLPGETSEPQTQVGNAELYWNIDRLTYTKDAEVLGTSTRAPAEDGKFYIRFAYGGEQVQLQIVDKQLVNFIDNMDVMGLVFDADGVVVDAIAPTDIATKTAVDFYVRSYENGVAVINSSIAMNGMELRLNITEMAQVMDVTMGAEKIGQYSEMGVFDRVSVWSNANDEVTHVYITDHPKDAEIYWRVERLYDATTGQTARESDENGVYTIQFAHKGELVDLKCRDKDLVNEIDVGAILLAQFALVLDEEGYIVESIDVGMALRGSYYASDYHVTGIDGNNITLTKYSAGSEQGTIKEVTLREDCEIYQCCQHGCYDDHCGESIDSLQLYDRVNVYTDLSGKGIMIFVSRRMVDAPMYYNLYQKYAGAEKGTSREKENGYYVFEMLKDGKLVKVKTSDKAIADFIDARSNRCHGLVVEGDIIKRAYDPSCVFGGIALGNKSPLSSMSGSVITVSDPSSGNSWNAVLSPDCKIYNTITGIFGKDPGGEIDLRVGDNVTTFRNYKDEIVMVFVTGRAVEGAKVYYNLDRQYNTETLKTKREKNAEGYYVFKMACEGKQVEVRTTSEAMATFMDSQNAPVMGLKVDKDGNVTAAYEITIAVPRSTKTANYHYVKNLNLKEGTFSTYYMENGQKKDSSILQQKIAKDCAIYNVSQAYENYRGEKAQLQNGDQIQAILNVETNEICMIFIMNRDPIGEAKTYNAYCEHCDKTVTWHPYAGGLYVEEDIHYYACSPYVLRQGIIGREKNDKTYDVVIDLKGKSVKGMGRAFLVYDKLTIMDTVGGGKIMGTTPSGDTATNGSTIMLLDGAEVNLLSGELTLSENSTLFGTSGGVVYIGEKCVFNMNGGKITGGISQDKGGNVFSYGTFNMTGGSISGGKSLAGENVFIGAGAGINMSGGSIEGGVYLTTAKHSSFSGAPVVSGSGIKLPAGSALTVSGLRPGASLVVDGDGVFTEKLTDPNTYLAYFKTASQDDKILIEGDTLTYNKKRENYNGIEDGDLSFTSGANAVCPVCKKEVTWTKLTADATVLEGGKHYYLAEDITYTGNKAPYITGPDLSKTACVHLNGKNITATAHRAVEGKAGVLNIMGEGTVSGSYNEDFRFGATVNMNGENGILNLIGGTYTKNTACTTAPVMVLRGGDVNMYDGAEVYSTANKDRANVQVYTRCFNLYGGKIHGGTGVQLGVSNWSPTISGMAKIYGGVIDGTIAVSGAENVRGKITVEGGTINGYVELNRNVEAVISGGTFNGTVNVVPAATNANSVVKLSGKPSILGSGLNLPEGYKITLGELSAEAKIRVAATGVFTDALENAEAIKAAFVPARECDEIQIEENALTYVLYTVDLNAVDNSNLVLSGNKAVCPACYSEVTWIALDSEAVTLEGGKHYYLTKDITYTGTEAPYITGPGAGLKACVHLNGKNITATANRVVEAKAGTLNIMGNGTVSGSYNESHLHASAVNMNGVNGVLNLIGGKYTESTSCTTAPVVVVRGGDVNMYNGAEIYSTANTNTRPNVQVYTNSFSLYGGKIHGGNGVQLSAGNWSPTISGIAYIYGGIIDGKVVVSGAETVRGTLVMTGGTVTGYMELNRYVNAYLGGGTLSGTVAIASAATNENSTVILGGDVTISGTGLRIPQGYKVELYELESAAEICVNAIGAFTWELENAEEAKDCFRPARESDEIGIEGGVLVYIEKEIDLNNVNNDDLVFTSGNKAVCPACGTLVEWTALTGNAITLEGGKHYYLADSVTYTGDQAAYITGPSAGLACVHLNGKNITATAYRAVENREGTLNIMGKGTVSGSYNANRLFGATLNTSIETGVLNLIGGTYTKNESCTTSPVLLLRGGSVNMYSGAEIYSTANSNSCANVQVYTKSFTLHGGMIHGGTGIQVSAGNWTTSNSGIVTIHGGVVDGKISMSGGETTHGKFTIDGGTVTGYTEVNRYVDATFGGGTMSGTVALGGTATNANSSITITGDAVIAGNGITVPNGYKLTLGEKTDKTSVKITASGAFTLESPKAADFISVFQIADDYEIVNENNVLICKEKAPEPEQHSFVLDPDGDGYAECPTCKQNVQWTALTQALGANCVTGGHYYLATDHTSEAQYLTNVGKTVCIHLNNKNLTYASRMFVAGGGVLNIMGDGSVTSNGTTTNAEVRTGAITTNGGTVNLYGGTYRSTGNALPVLKQFSNTTSAINVYEGIVIEESTGSASVVVEAGTFTASGAEISGGVHVTGATMNLAGASKVDSITVSAQGKLMVKADYTGTSSVSFEAMSGNTISTDNGACEAEFTGILTLNNANGAIIVGQEGVLVVDTTVNPIVLKGQRITAAAKAMTFPTDNTESVQVCPACEKEVTWKPLSAPLGEVKDGAEHHYYLTGKITSQYQFLTQTAGTVCLHMNGKDIDVASRLFVTGSSLNIMGTGTIKGLGTGGTQTGTLSVGNNGTASLYGCTITSVAAGGAPAIRTMTGSTATVNMYDGTTIGGEKGTCFGTNVAVEKGIFNMYGGTIQNGSGQIIENVRKGGNICVYSGTEVNLYAGTVTGGTAEQGGNICITSGTVTISEGVTVTLGEATSVGGNVNMLGTASLTTAGNITNGKTTGNAAHGGNISLTSGCTLVISGGKITGGEANGQGGNIRSWSGTIAMTAGEISGGNSIPNSNDNVWAAGTTVMTMLGGTIKGTQGTEQNGTAIYLTQTAVLYLGGDAQVIRDDGVKAGNILVTEVSGTYTAVRILNNWTGSASVRWQTNYAADSVVSAERGGCGALNEGVFTAGGSYTGTLTYEPDTTLVVKGEDGKLKLATAQ